MWECAQRLYKNKSQAQLPERTRLTELGGLRGVGFADSLPHISGFKTGGESFIDSSATEFADDDVFGEGSGPRFTE